jgi:hypothetical protein
VFAFDNGILATGENSWYLILRSDQDWVKGSYTMESPEDSDIPTPDGADESENDNSDNPVVPEPASLILMGLGAAGVFKRKRK